MSKTIKIIVGLITLLLIIGVIILINQTKQKIESEQVTETSVKLKIGSVPVMGSVVLEVAKAKNFYQEENLDVEIERVKSSKVLMAALENGELDIVFTSRSAGTFNYLFKDERLRIVADAHRVLPIIIIRKDLQDSIKELKDLKGKIFATPRAGSTSQYFLVRILESVGLSLDDVVSKSLKAQEAVTALEAGNLDAATINEPYATLAINKGIGVKLAADEIAKIFSQGQQHAVLITTTDFLANKDIAQRFFRAYKKAADYYLTAKQGNEPERSEVIRIVADYTGVEPEIINKIEWIDISSDLKPDISYMEEAQEWYWQNGFLEKKVDLSQKVDLSFLP